MTVREGNDGGGGGGSAAEKEPGPAAARAPAAAAARGAPAVLPPTDAFFPPSTDPPGAWIEERRRAFNDFERSFWDGATPASSPSVASPPPPSEASPHLALAARDPFGPPPSLLPPFQPRPLFALEDRGHPSSWEAPVEATTMLSSRDSGQDLSPKARVTYDDGRFQVNTVYGRCKDSMAVDMGTNSRVLKS